MFDKTTRHAVAAALRKYVKIADLAQTTPFDVKHGRNGDVTGTTVSAKTVRKHELRPTRRGDVPRIRGTAMLAAIVAFLAGAATASSGI
jgi:hypothetical protein